PHRSGNNLIGSKMAAVYIETSIVSYLTSRASRDIIVRARQKISVEWWNLHRQNFDLYTSPLVLVEARRGDSKYASLREKALNGIPLLASTNDVTELAKALVARG